VRNLHALTYLALACCDHSSRLAVRIDSDGTGSDATIVHDAHVDDAHTDGSSSGCETVSGIAFPTESSVLYIQGGKETRQLKTGVAQLSSSLNEGQITISIYDGTPGGFGPGTWPLACTPGAACTTGQVYDATTGRKYGPSAGTLTVTSVASPKSNEMTGTLHGLELRAMSEIPVDGGFAFTIDPGGPCLTVPDLAFDTTAPIGKPCHDHIQCGTTKVCDIASGTCAASECTNNAGCGTGQTCNEYGDEFQYQGSEKFCATPCGPFAACPGSYVCDIDSVCKHPGPSLFGQPCTPFSDVHTGCKAGLVCTATATQTACAHGCNPFATAPGCQSTERCLYYVSSYCGPPSPTASTAAIDQPCTLVGGAHSGPCGDDGKTYRGLCYEELGVGSQMMCRRVCDPSGPACPNGHSCQNVGVGWGGVQYVCR
jgi:hypothetical protein